MLTFAESGGSQSLGLEGAEHPQDQPEGASHVAHEDDLLTVEPRRSGAGEYEKGARTVFQVGRDQRGHPQTVERDAALTSFVGFEDRGDSGIIVREAHEGKDL